jgi:hypothetical protein
MGGGYTETKTGGRMPGSGIARRSPHVIILADCPGSMTGKKIQALVSFMGDPRVPVPVAGDPACRPER